MKKSSINYRRTAITAILFFIPLSILRSQNTPPNPDKLREIPTSYFENFIGTWQVPDTLLAKYPPRMTQKPLVSMEWGSKKRIIRLYEVHAPGKKEESVLEGMIFWNPVSFKVEFYTYNKDSDFFFKGEYTILEKNRIQRTYQVYYPSDHHYYKIGNAVITFQETSTLSEDKNILYNHLIYYNKKGNSWDLWSKSALFRKE